MPNLHTEPSFGQIEMRISPISKLTELSALTTSRLRPDDAIQRAIPLIREGLAAKDVFLVYGAGDGFRFFGSRPDFSLSEIALWLINRDLTSRGKPHAFDVINDRVVNFRSPSTRRSAHCVAALIPLPNGIAEMLVAKGPWRNGLSGARMRFLLAALPSLALLLDRRLDASRAAREQHQLSALANINRVMSESEDLETVLTSIAGTIAAVAGIDYISIDITNADGSVQMRCVSSARQGTDQLQAIWKQAKDHRDPVRDAVLRTGQPMVFPDAQNDERIPAAGRNYFVRTLLRSTGTFPLVAKDQVLGVLSLASHRPLDFDASEVELLEGLADQVATAVTGIRLYQEVTESHEQLQQLNERLLENMSVEHHLARTDVLTGIPNRRFIDEMVDTECARSLRQGLVMSVVLADLDHLKRVNDTSGHGAGDEALKYVARMARESCRQMDMVGRYGGDEFVFVLPSTRLEDAARFAERFRQRLAETPIRVRDTDLARLTVSVGVAQWDNETMDGPTSLIRQADRAMYAAKDAGRDRTMLAEGDSARAA